MLLSFLWFAKNRWLEKNHHKPPCFPEMVKLHGDKFPMVESIFKKKHHLQNQQIHVFSPSISLAKRPVFCVMLDCWAHFHKTPYSNDFKGWDSLCFFVFSRWQIRVSKIARWCVAFREFTKSAFTTHGLRCFEGENLWHLERHMAGGNGEALLYSRRRVVNHHFFKPLFLGVSTSRGIHRNIVDWAKSPLSQQTGSSCFH